MNEDEGNLNMRAMNEVTVHVELEVEEEEVGARKGRTVNEWKVYDECRDLCSFSSDSSCQLNVFGHDGDSLCMNGTQVCIFK